MIRKLTGRVESKETDSVIIDVGGVGYGAFCSGNTLNSIPPTGESTSLFIETHVREDHIHLFGFATAEEQKSFRILIKVSGVGAKMAMAILSTLSPAQLTSALASQDKAAFKAVSGVGPKLAARIITELKDKFSFTQATILPSNQDKANADAVFTANNNINDAISALVNLGYGRSDAYNAVNKIAAQNDNTEIDSLIREGLKELGIK